MNSEEIANNEAVAANDAKAEALAEVAERMALALDGWSYEGNPDAAEFIVADSENPDTPVTAGINRVYDEPGASFVVETGDGRRVTVLVLEEHP